MDKIEPIDEDLILFSLEKGKAVEQILQKINQLVDRVNDLIDIAHHHTHGP